MSSISDSLAFAEWLHDELNKRQWSQADLARYSDLSRAVINKLLNGRTYPQPTTLDAISRALKVPVETTYRKAGLLPKISSQDDYAAEIVHKLSLIKDAQRRNTALRLLDALIEEEHLDEAD
jgi:transcriptional regulator with XRE-family HTH domain